MSNRIADLRATIKTLDEADNAFRELALLTKFLRVEDARHELRVARQQEQHAEATAQRRAQLATLKTTLAAYVSANEGSFNAPFPRTRKSEFGEYGLRTATELVISDEDALVNELLERGYDDCLKVTRTAVKPAIRNRLAADETLPGCSLNTGPTVVCKVAKALLEQADEEAIG